MSSSRSGLVAVVGLALLVAVCALLLAALAGATAAVGGEPAPVNLEQEAHRVFDRMVREFSNLGDIAGRRERSFHPAAALERDDRDPVDVILRRTQVLAEDVQRLGPIYNIQPYVRQLVALQERAAAPEPEWKSTRREVETAYGMKEQTVQVLVNAEERYPLFEEAYRLQRKIALANPLLDFSDIVFVKHHPALFSHMCDQYFGIIQNPGGGVYVLEDAFGKTPKLRDVLADAVCTTGRLKGQKLTPGSFVSPELSFDRRTIYFAYTEAAQPFRKTDDPENNPYMYYSKYKKAWRMDKDKYHWEKENAFHLFSVNVDGTDLRMLTDGDANDFDPCVLPNGRVAFISERRGGEGRCHPRPCPSYVLHSMLPDGSDIYPISWHETNEWHPSVTPEGQILYTRWDYVDRDVTAGEHTWITTPDGRDARAVHANYSEGRAGQIVFEPRSIPGTDYYVATSSMHHCQNYGTLVIYDRRVTDENGPWVFLTPDEDTGHTTSAYATAWPLGENYYLCAYSPDSPPFYQNRNQWQPQEEPVKHGIYLLDAFGNKQLLYRDQEIGSISPIPLRARPRPLRIPHRTEVALPVDMQEQAPAEPSEKATVSVIDVYDSLRPWPEDRKIKSLRIIQLFPKSTPRQDKPAIGYGQMMNARAVLGKVPVEDDGSAHFKLPARKPVYFQALDENGLAIQSMKSDIYVHPGETLSCRGCHEPRAEAGRPRADVPRALRREPSAIELEVNRGRPITFASLVQPVLDARCVECHAKNADEAPGLTGERAKGRWSEAYVNLQEHVWYVCGRDKEHQFGMRSTPGELGAYVSPLYKMLTTGSHKDKVKLSREELARITLWIDANAPFLGAYRKVNEQLAGEIVQPILE